MGGIRAVVGASIEEEEAAGSSSDPAGAPPTVAPQPVPVGPAGDATAKEASETSPSAEPVEEAAQSDPTGSAAVSDTTSDPPSISLPVASAEPEPVTNATAEEILPRPAAPDPCAPLTVCVDEAPPLDTSGVSLDDVHQLPAVGDPPEPTTVAEAPGQDMLLMVAPSAPDCPPTPPEPSTGMDDQKVSPVEE